MREIKFRAINNETGEFVYGWLTRLTEGIRRFMAIVQEEGEDDELVRYYIHSEGTIGQFTGLHDINGVEIYEGDVVRYKDYSRGAVISLSGAEDCQPRKVAQIKIGNLLSGIKLYGIGILDGDNMEVIGNIHQNPELLEQNL